MNVFWLPDKGVDFPNPQLADAEGLLAIGGDLSVERLISAYACGIFPWYSEDSPVLWWSPDPRFVLYPEKLHIPRSLRRVLNARRFTVTMDTAFPQVIRNCACALRPNQNGTWIVPEVVRAYTELHAHGIAHSVEAWNGHRLVGGIYGVSLGRVFFGESMFFNEPDASKVVLVWLVRLLRESGFAMLDCQQVSDNLARFGAECVPRSRFLGELSEALRTPTVQGLWAFPESFFPL
ncbi:leucyl/phenylalanyl-tRNA--protein transferase [Desulfovibrio psychrotolerans]|uniref:Leucyl/phenylalanyl-tRNA--protein transferase n=1 Tax=Desulfovibrio psychrotolerans TaxID=415242 RepID=A0A7J0BXI8_9BACT|nr:leucyl/phenylalanyl-tRNA--protein transferase [Desulfovibrio psychrotolerans]GFM38403.1 leucyl/phenylalanyl-tRNA--protein transferase [Desulfovibrio psychrotolerans]